MRAPARDRRRPKPPPQRRARSGDTAQSAVPRASRSQARCPVPCDDLPLCATTRQGGHHDRQPSYGFDTLQIHAGARPRSGHRRATGADLPDHRLCLPRRRTRRRALQPSGSRLHLLAPDQPHRSRLAGTCRDAGGRRGRGLLLFGPCGADHGAFPADGAGAQRRGLDPALRRLDHPVQPDHQALRLVGEIRRLRRSRRGGRRHRRRHPRGVLREHREPGGYITDLDAIAEVASKAGLP